MNNSDMNKLMEILSKMDQKELQNGIAKANEILKNNSKEDILKKMKNM